MKKCFSIVLILFCLSASISAERSAEVLLRFSRHDNVTKIVIESEENLIRNANTTTTAASARVDFPSPFDLKKPHDFVFETVRDARTLTIKLRDATEVERISSPHRQGLSSR